MAMTAHTEAIMIANLYRDTGIFDEKDRNAIRSNLRSYVNHVINFEWGTQYNLPQTQDIMEKIWRAYYDIDVTNKKIQLWYTESISKLNEFIDARLSRLFNAHEHLGTMMWSILLIGALITISFMFFFGLESMMSQMIMTTLLTGYLIFMLHLVYSLDNVFKGQEGIKPTAFEQLLPLLDGWDQDSLNN